MEKQHRRPLLYVDVSGPGQFVDIETTYLIKSLSVHSVQ